MLVQCECQAGYLQVVEERLQTGCPKWGRYIFIAAPIVVASHLSNQCGKYVLLDHLLIAGITSSVLGSLGIIFTFSFIFDRMVAKIHYQLAKFVMRHKSGCWFK